MAELLEQANSTCFTVCFTSKVDDAAVRERLAKCSQAELDEGKKLAKEILAGKETTIIGRLSQSEGKLGRSLVIDLPTQGYRQVDHRTLQSLTIRNVKYSIKK